MLLWLSQLSFKIEDHSNRKSLRVIDNSFDFPSGEEDLGIIDYRIFHSTARKAAGPVGNDAGFTEFAVTDITFYQIIIKILMLIISLFQTHFVALSKA